MSKARRLAPGLWLLALFLVFLGERVLGSGPWRMAALVPAALCVLAVLAGRFSELSLVSGGQRRAVTPSLLGYGAAALGLLLIPLSTESFTEARGFDPEMAESWRQVFTVLWLLLVGTGSITALAADLARAGLNKPERAEVRRVTSAAMGGLSLALAFGWVVTLNFVANENDELFEMADSARVRPSADTVQLVEALKNPVELVLFFPSGNEVLEQVRPYFDKLTAADSQLTMTLLDHAVEPLRAKELGARKNGVAFLVRGSDKQRVDLDTDYKKAKRKIKNLDRKFQEALLKVGRDKGTLYLTQGHGERDASMPEGDERTPVKLLKDGLKDLNVTTKNLGLKEGLAGDIPEDAGLIMVVGPTDPFLPEEVENLRAWYKNGGALLLALEPDVDHGLDALLADMGLEAQPGVVCNDRFFVKEEGGTTDRAQLFSARFGSHPTVAMNAKFPTKLPVILSEAGALHPVTGTDARTQVLVRTMQNSYRDLNGDRKKNGDDPEESNGIAYASSTESGETESRAVVIMDADFLADRWLLNRGNARFIGDAYGWLAREEDNDLRVIAPEEDPPLRHTNEQNARWFAVTVYGVPLLVLGVGLSMVRIRRRKGGRS